MRTAVDLGDPKLIFHRDGVIQSLKMRQQTRVVTSFAEHVEVFRRARYARVRAEGIGSGDNERNVAASQLLQSHTIKCLRASDDRSGRRRRHDDRWFGLL